MTYIEEIGKKAKEASSRLGLLGVEKKNEALSAVRLELIKNTDEILKANEKDVNLAKVNKMSDSLVDRLLLTSGRIQAIADSIDHIIKLSDPIGEVLSMVQRPNGLVIGQKRVPLGVIGIIYESRPNVTVDAFALCFKTGNAVILRGGSDAIYSNIAIANTIRKALSSCDILEDSIQLVEDTSRDVAREFMRLNQFVDVLIPRGGASLIKTVMENSTIPVIETGTGNCHIYVDEFADLSMALDIIDNAKTQRLGVCNACESLVVHEKIAHEFLPRLQKRLGEKEVEIRGCKASKEICEDFLLAQEEDFYTEYLDNKISLIIVDSIGEAILHINTHNTKHSEAIITNNYQNGMRFHNEIDAAAVYINASTRFTDGGEFGFGAEIGISTQKLHARGPMGLNALTTTKYIIFGNGQVR